MKLSLRNLPRTLTRPLIEGNPVTLQMLGICSALAVTKTLETSLVMGAVVIAVLVVSNGTISLLRQHIPQSTRLVLQVTIIASLVIVVDQVLRAFAPRMSQELSIFVGLIITNCIVLGRAEGFAMRNPIVPSLLDGLGNGLGYALVLILVGGIRELFGAGTVLGYVVLPLDSAGGWFHPIGLMKVAPSGFFLIAFLVWGARRLRPEQIEPVAIPSSLSTETSAKQEVGP